MQAPEQTVSAGAQVEHVRFQGPPATLHQFLATMWARVVDTSQCPVEVTAGAPLHARAPQPAGDCSISCVQLRFTIPEGDFYTNLEHLQRRWDKRMHGLWGLGLARQLLVDLFFEDGILLEVIVVVRK